MATYGKMQRVLAVMLVASFLLTIAAFALPTPAVAQYCWEQKDHFGCYGCTYYGNPGKGYDLYECCTTSGPLHECDTLEGYCFAC
jgi:hypothetical protein